MTECAWTIDSYLERAKELIKLLPVTRNAQARKAIREEAVGCLAWAIQWTEDDEDGLVLLHETGTPTEELRELMKRAMRQFDYAERLEEQLLNQDRGGLT